MERYLYDFLADVMDEQSIIAFYNTFKGNLYVKDMRITMREEKILNLWNEYKRNNNTNEENYRQIAKEVQYIMPSTTPRSVKHVILKHLGQKHGKSC